MRQLSDLNFRILFSFVSTEHWALSKHFFVVYKTKKSCHFLRGDLFEPFLGTKRSQFIILTLRFWNWREKAAGYPVRYPKPIFHDQFWVYTKPLCFTKPKYSHTSDERGESWRHARERATWHCLTQWLAWLRSREARRRRAWWGKQLTKSAPRHKRAFMFGWEQGGSTLMALPELLF